MLEFKIQYGEIYRTTITNEIIHLTPFKIQYGEIYSKAKESKEDIKSLFKIQYGEIYSRKNSVGVKSKADLKSSMERFIVFLCLAISLLIDI